jgi:hypothetical protein
MSGRYFSSRSRREDDFVRLDFRSSSGVAGLDLDLEDTTLLVTVTAILVPLRGCSVRSISYHSNA